MMFIRPRPLWPLLLAALLTVLGGLPAAGIASAPAAEEEIWSLEILAQTDSRAELDPCG